MSLLSMEESQRNSNDHEAMTTEIRMLEFFSGIGGMRIAVEAALDRLANDDDNDNNSNNTRLSFCQAYDISLYANHCYQHNFHPTSDVSDVNAPNGSSKKTIVDGSVSTKLVEQLKPKDIDEIKANLWTMSPPCQPFTSNGATGTKKNLDSNDKRCHGLKGLIRLLTSIENKPRWILLENVKGFATSDMAQEWFACLRQNGYSWKSYLLSPIQYGIPNHRQRFYILAERSERWSSDDLEQRPVTQPCFSRAVKTTGETRQLHTVGDYLSATDIDSLIVPDAVLEKNFAKNLGIVTAADTATHCFTAGYGRIYHRSTGSLLLMESFNTGGDSDKSLPAVADQPIDRSNMLNYSGHLRRFAPNELLALFGFPMMYEFPSDISLEHQYKLIGNSISIFVVTELIMELLGSNEASCVLENPPGRASNGDSFMVGGIKGHEEEEITGELLKLYQKYRWKMIPNCTGRHTCRDHELVSQLSPIEFLETSGLNPPGREAWQEYGFDLPDRPDRVLVVPMDVGKTVGLITFVKNNGESYVHTLNAPSGFRRKLEAIGIQVTSEDISQM